AGPGPSRDAARWRVLRAPRADLGPGRRPRRLAARRGRPRSRHRPRRGQPARGVHPRRPIRPRSPAPDRAPPRPKPEPKMTPPFDPIRPSSQPLARPAAPVTLDASPRRTEDPFGPYVLSAQLATTVNVALALDQPLLVTGEPGCGKTALAWAVAA